MVYPHTYRTEHSETRTTNAEYGQYYAQSQSKKIKIQPQLLKILQYVDSNRVQIVQDLREAVKIQSTSDDLINKDNIINMVKFAEKWLLELGVKYECFNIGTREIKGKRYKLPPVILGNIGSDKEKRLSEGLDEFLLTKKLDYLFDVDYVIACGSEWIGEKYPCIVYGGVALSLFTGLIHFVVEVEKSENSTSDVKKDLGRVFDALIDKKGKVTAPGFYDNVSQITPDEERLYEDIQDFDLDGIRYYIQIHLNITNKVDLKVLSSTRPWLEDITSANYQAARRATIQIYKEDPNMIRDDTDNIVINIITRILEVNMLLLPLSTKSTNIGKENENIPLRNLYEGTKLLGAYLFQLNEIEQINS
ncbi:beta-ala-his dipeptidase [Holotrichia oblita]|uniref:Beta-ala-his dipeptidase n=1 Tax=Holotrichia oblita TaxID=644536 RepID=A0ACB9T3Q7_HOLOL|nr:beta-ala-his dipeptidase [Holotrichia oblita]